MVVASSGCSNSSRNIITVICFAGDFYNNTILSEILVDHSFSGLAFQLLGDCLLPVLLERHIGGGEEQGE